MSVLKRTASSRATRMMARASPYHTSVTLFESQDQEDSKVTAATSSPSPPPRRSKRIKLETEITSDTVDFEEGSTSKTKVKGRKVTTVKSSSSSPTKQLVKSPRKPKAVQQSLAIPHPAPENWREAYDAIKNMRSRIVAPVDTMGCDQAQYKEDEPRNRRLATLVSLMLSSQTKDEVTDAAVSKLRSALGGSITVDNIIEADETTISEAIAKVGFWRRKTEYIKKTALRLRDDFGSDVPQTVDELCSLPGVGPKMAFLALQVAWNLNLGIGVDVHVHRISNRLGWHKPPTKTPEETRLNLESWLPKELHPDINHMLVGFGQMLCLPVGPKCDSCDLSSRDLCPSAKKTAKPKIRKIIKSEEIPESPPKIGIELELDDMISMPPDTLSVKNEA